MRKFSITGKIWLSIGIFILGFVFSTVLGQVQGRNAERDLRLTSATLFPAAQKSQEAEAAFQRLVKALGDAAMTQDVAQVERAFEEGRRVADGLRSIGGIAGLANARMQEAGNLASTVETFAVDARTLYKSVLADTSGMNAETQRKMRDLVVRTDALKAALKQLKEAASQDLRDELSAMEHRSATQRSLMVLVFLITLAIAGAIVHLTIRRSIAAPLTAVVGQLNHIARGDVSGDVAPEFTGRSDEIGLLANAMQTMSVTLRDVLQDLVEGVEVMSSSSSELTASSGKMSDGSRNASAKTHMVAASAEEMSANVMSVAASMDQTTSDLTDITTSTEQMTATISEIAGNSEKARHVTEEASRQAVCISEQMNELGTAARQIGRVTETITEISSQINLLALNATIEAARAGTAGKGFAVVANEIKELAKQTAIATEDIKSRIADVQTCTAKGIGEIGKITHVIGDVSEIVSSIAAAIEEQSTVTKEMAHHISEALTEVRDANTRVAETSSATMGIAREILGVDRAAGQMAEGSEQVKANAGALSEVAERLHTTVQRFKV